MSDVTNGIFSDYCYDKMWELFKTPEDEVGSEFLGNKGNSSITNCVIYVSNVLIYGHEKIGRMDRNERIEQLGRKEQNGSKLAKYLVEEIGWTAYYWNADVRNGRNGESEHSFSYQEVLNKKRYLPDSTNLPISGLVVDYNKQNKTSKRVWIPTPVDIPNPIVPVRIPIPIPVDVPADNTAILEKVSKVKFAYGIARGATHTFLFSYGEIFEVHYEQQGAKLLW